MNSLQTVKGLISQNFTIIACNCIANNDIARLYQMGLDDKAIACLSKISNKDLKLLTLAFEKALSIQTQVDSNILVSVLINHSKQYEQEILINNLITSGASFEMIRYFIKTHTNRTHTQLRQDFKVNDSEIHKSNKAIPQSTADKFFESFLVKNQSINAQDILTFSRDNNYSVNSIWRELKFFINNDVNAPNNQILLK
ncbi:hypothetical protein MS2017_1123 [Bathymodiolus thermophilus thioautotrophic gill symbiont]|uniref:Uncharacterized protein n=1 Tax=Bathymodiolus thermophilus thioautotrophic gill symbiont TaxID=2360 RepID=A0A3G3ILU8_9GAMM|nr:STY4526/YPO1902 family pathogenicity island replication protein [Bathymodiolus thermophilus thioautotrophic gill symbiont]AYQ56827.1 hypothetical protein MS2017_1123 [Bathymodiolus thermophilus thioautotrophic gill symbiont]